MIQPEQNAALKDKFKSCNGEYLGIRNDLEVDGRSQAVRMRTVSVTSSVDKNIMTVTERVSSYIACLILRPVMEDSLSDGRYESVANSFLYLPWFAS